MAVLVRSAARRFPRRASAPCVGLTTPRYVTPARGGGARSKVCYAPREIAAHNPASALRLTPRGSKGAGGAMGEMGEMSGMGTCWMCGLDYPERGLYGVRTRWGWALTCRGCVDLWDDVGMEPQWAERHAAWRAVREGGDRERGGVGDGAGDGARE